LSVWGENKTILTVWITWSFCCCCFCCCLGLSKVFFQKWHTTWLLTCVAELFIRLSRTKERTNWSNWLNGVTIANEGTQKSVHNDSSQNVWWKGKERTRWRTQKSKVQMRVGWRSVMLNWEGVWCVFWQVKRLHPRIDAVLIELKEAMLWRTLQLQSQQSQEHSIGVVGKHRSWSGSDDL